MLLLIAFAVVHVRVWVRVHERVGMRHANDMRVRKCVMHMWVRMLVSVLMRVRMRDTRGFCCFLILLCVLSVMCVREIFGSGVMVLHV